MWVVTEADRGATMLLLPNEYQAEGREASWARGATAGLSPGELRRPPKVPGASYPPPF